MNPLLITGCGRSGTAYVSVVLSAAGYWCGHERVISIDHVGKLVAHHLESSGAAVPYLAEMSSEVVVVHQVRHPLRVAASAVARGFPHSRSGLWTAERCPSVIGEPSQIEAALRYWHDWNRLTEARANLRWQIEQVDADRLAEALALSGRAPDLLRLRAAIALVPRTLNHQPDVPALTWDDIPPGPARLQARCLAKDYGYDD